MELHVHDVRLSDELHLSKLLLLVTESFYEESLYLLHYISMYPFRKNQLNCLLTLRHVNTWDPPRCNNRSALVGHGTNQQSCCGSFTKFQNLLACGWQGPSTPCTIYLQVLSVFIEQCLGRRLTFYD